LAGRVLFLLPGSALAVIDQGVGDDAVVPGGVVYLPSQGWLSSGPLTVCATSSSIIKV
jgi:hypothetical protein